MLKKLLTFNLLGSYNKFKVKDGQHQKIFIISTS